MVIEGDTHEKFNKKDFLWKDFDFLPMGFKFSL